LEWLIVVMAGLLWVIHTAIKECSATLKKILTSNYRLEDQLKLMTEHVERLDTSIDRLHQDVVRIREVSDDIYTLNVKPRKIY